MHIQSISLDNSQPFGAIDTHIIFERRGKINRMFLETREWVLGRITHCTFQLVPYKSLAVLYEISANICIFKVGTNSSAQQATRHEDETCPIESSL